MSIVISEERAERSESRPGAIIGGVAIAAVAVVGVLVRIRTRRTDVVHVDVSSIPASLRRDIGLPPAEPVKDWSRF